MPGAACSLGNKKTLPTPGHKTRQLRPSGRLLLSNFVPTSACRAGAYLEPRCRLRTRSSLQ